MSSSPFLLRFSRVYLEPCGSHRGLVNLSQHRKCNCPERFARSAVEYIGLADQLENHNTPPYSSLGGDWRCATYLPSSPIYSQRRRVVLAVLDSLVLYRGISDASAPYDAVGSDMQPLRVWAKSYDVSGTYEVPLSWLLYLESEASRYLPYANKPVRTCP